MGFVTGPTLTGAVEALYGAAPASFVATRTALARAAKTAGDTDLATRIGALRKPVAAAHLVNRMARAGRLAPLAELGERFRDAQTRLDPAAMKQLAARRTELIAELTRQAGDLDPESSATTLARFGETCTASIASARAQRAVLSGALVNPLSYSGFGEVDLSGALARPDPPALRLVPPRDGPDDTDTGTDAGDREAEDAGAGGTDAGGTEAADAARGEPDSLPGAKWTRKGWAWRYTRRGRSSRSRRSCTSGGRRPRCGSRNRP